MLELHQLQIRWNDVEAWEIGSTNNPMKWTPLIIIPDSAIKSLVLANVEFWLEAVKRRERRLRIEIYRQNAISTQRKELRDMGSGRCLS